MAEANTTKGKVFVLSCIDLRVMDEIACFMRHMGNENEYDHFILAGAAYGVLNTTYPNWSQVFWEHLDLAFRLHKLDEIWIFEHSECGAYKELGSDAMKRVENGVDQQAMFEQHRAVAEVLQTKLRERGYFVPVRGFYLHLPPGKTPRERDATVYRIVGDAPPPSPGGRKPCAHPRDNATGGKRAFEHNFAIDAAPKLPREAPTKS